ncbi:DUF72 domain-containing protein [Tabrizicola sp.]|uniref:DUF72 domain-containing protein n=1 Tax=Tabrizicola sp. TaxID=2005166 RepID=UPI001A5777F6|nr:DUF72 domain-containing protein [Tabrizicola sp.]MBL9063563.1 DUF72 domain-containing protein [Tabrizicola sp.]
MPHPIRIGVGGWTFEPWRSTFFPPGLRQAEELHFASRALTTIEVNGTYYGTQKPETFAKWAKETPDGFVFTLKAPRFATARRVLAEGTESITRFLASGLTELGPKLGPINWQLPPTKKFDPADVAAFLDFLPDRLEGLPLRHAIEARHDSFACDEFTTLLRDRNIAAIQAEDTDYPLIDAATAPFAYLRIMGTREAEPLGYSEADLDRWATRLRDMAAAREVFLFVISGHKAANPAAALALIQRL